MDLRATRSITGRCLGRRNGEESGGYGSRRYDELKKLNEISPRSSAKRKSRRGEGKKEKFLFSCFLFLLDTTRHEIVSSKWRRREKVEGRRLLLLEVWKENSGNVESKSVRIQSKVVEMLTTPFYFLAERGRWCCEIENGSEAGAFCTACLTR